MVGLVVGVFMFGLVAGSFLANRRLGRVGEDPSRRPGLRSLVALDLAVTTFAAGLVLVLAGLRASSADWPVQLATFGLVAAAGVLGGLVFPLAACVRLGDEPRIERVAGAVSAADSLGACAGALVTGVALVPVLGISGTLLVVVTMKALSALLVGVAAVMRGEPARV
jgi:predicted membrane-bound spermidine synthase